MMNRPEDSAPGMATVVELLGPLIDDRGSFTRTLAEVAAGEGVVLRPGALDQVGGGATAWALATLLEGHGRSDLAEGAEELARRVQREWEGMARSGLHRPAPGSAITWPSLRTGGAVLVLFGGEPDLARALLEDAGLGGETRGDAADDWRHKPLNDYPCSERDGFQFASGRAALALRTSSTTRSPDAALGATTPVRGLDSRAEAS